MPTGDNQKHSCLLKVWVLHFRWVQSNRKLLYCDICVPRQKGIFSTTKTTQEKPKVAEGGVGMARGSAGTNP